MATLPPSVQAEVKATLPDDLFPISGPITLKNHIVKAKVISISDAATMTLSPALLQMEWVAFVAQELVFASSSTKAVIQRPIDPSTVDAVLMNQRGADGTPGVPGVSNQGVDGNNNGIRGGDGGVGGRGGAGGTVVLPTVYIMAGAVRCQDGKPPKGVKLRIDMTGFQGGHGGDGGPGGSGGGGNPGGPAQLDWILGIPKCKHSGGNGGDAGTPGSGGQAGVGGKGGDGGSVVIVAPSQVLSSMTFFEILQEPGPKGIGGRAGKPGQRLMTGGPAGSGEGPCGGGNPGAPSPPADPPDYGNGIEGPDGVRGTSGTVTLDVSGTLF